MSLVRVLGRGIWISEAYGVLYPKGATPSSTRQSSLTSAWARLGVISFCLYYRFYILISHMPSQIDHLPTSSGGVFKTPTPVYVF